MADVNDAGDRAGKHARQLKLLREADINEQDREAIAEFHEIRQRKGCKLSTLTTDLSALRCASERAAVPLTQMTKSDYDDLLNLLVKPSDEGGYGLTIDSSGMFNYTRSGKNFFEWMDDRDDYGSFPFHDEIEMPKQTVERQPEEERLTPNDIEELKRAAGRGRNTQRDRALVAFLSEGPRITLTTQLRVGDIHLDEHDPYWTPNPEGHGQKDVDNRKRTLHSSLAELRVWIRQGHPDPENPEAPLWPVQHYDPQKPHEGALSADGVRGMLNRAADRAGIEKPVNPHNFRHAAMTRLSNDEGLTPQEIQHLAGWKDTRMLDVYDETTDRERNDAIRERLGMETAADEKRTTPDPRPCWNCRELLRGERFCPNCGEARDRSTRQAEQQARTDIRDGLATEAEDPEKVAARTALLDALDDPEAMDQLAKAVAHQLD